MYMYECTVPNGKKNYICVFSTRVMERMHKSKLISLYPLTSTPWQ